jgi:hypothetical protein
MTDDLVEEIYALARDAIKGGQDYFQVQAYPFRMTAANLAKHAANPHFEFWKMLKEGSDLFELTNYPPKVDVCEKRYLFNRVAEEGEDFRSRDECPPVTMPGSLLSAWQKHLEKEKIEFRKALTRHKLLGTFKETALAGTDVENISLMAQGSEILPPATPEKVPEPTDEAAPATASAAENSGIVSAAENEAVLTGQPIESQPDGEQQAARSGTGVAAVPEQSPNAAAVSAEPDEPLDDSGTQGNIVRAIPLPERAPRAGEQVAGDGDAVATPTAAPVQGAPDPVKKKPWWIRKTKEEPTSLTQ